ncbi:MAG: T9SS type A sorting domain-containing protein, partial [Chitinophagales bacterium]
LKQYVVERSVDGRNYVDIAKIPGGESSFYYNDKNISPGNLKVMYRISAEGINGGTTYSSVNAVQLCGQKQQQIKIYPTITNSYFVISGLYTQQAKKVLVEVVDANGRKIITREFTNVNGTQTLYFDKTPAPGSYFVVIRNEETTEILHTQKITVGI